MAKKKAKKKSKSTNSKKAKKKKVKKKTKKKAAKTKKKAKKKVKKKTTKKKAKKTKKKKTKAKKKTTKTKIRKVKKKVQKKAAKTKKKAKTQKAKKKAQKKAAKNKNIKNINAKISAETKTILKAIQTEKSWKDKIKYPNEEFIQTAIAKLSAWSEKMVKLSRSSKNADAEAIAQAICKLQQTWGEELFPLKKFNSFVRDMFEVDGTQVLAAQYFKWLPYYEGHNTGIEKLYRFQIIKGDKVVMIYYLERSPSVIRHIEDKGPGPHYYHVLGRETPGSHQQIQPYDNKEPSYAQVKKDVIKSLKGIIQPTVMSIK